MTQILGRLTSDAQVRTFPEGAGVVNFTIAVNDWYKPKGAAEGVEVVEYIRCNYWQNTAVAKVLKKGAFVEAQGRLQASAYLKGNEPVGQINLHVQVVKVHAPGKSTEESQPQAEQLELVPVAAPEQKDDKATQKGKKRTPRQRVYGEEVPAGPVDDLPF